MEESWNTVQSRDGTSWVMPNAPEDAVADSRIASLALFIQGGAGSSEGAGHDGEDACSSLASSVESIGAPAEQPAEEPRAPCRRSSPLYKAALALFVFAAVAAACADARAWRRTYAPATPAHGQPDASKLSDARPTSPSAGGANDTRPHTGEPRSLAFLASALRKRMGTPCSIKQVGLSLGLGVLGLAVGIPYVPGVTDNLFVGLVAGALPIAADLPCGLPQWQQWAGSTFGIVPNATAMGDASGHNAWVPTWAW